MKAKDKKRVLTFLDNATPEQLVEIEKIMSIAPIPDPDSTPEKCMEIVPKNFLIRCPKCRWGRMTTGCKPDLKDLTEIPGSPVLHGKRKFRCPECGGIAVMTRMRGNGVLSKSEKEV